MAIGPACLQSSAPKAVKGGAIVITKRTTPLLFVTRHHRTRHAIKHAYLLGGRLLGGQCRLYAAAPRPLAGASRARSPEGTLVLLQAVRTLSAESGSG